MSASTMPGLIRPDSATDPALVAAYRNGDERAAAELVARHTAALGRFLYSLGADPRGPGRPGAGDPVPGLPPGGELAGRGIVPELAVDYRRATLLRDQIRKRKGQLVSIEGRDIPDRADPAADFAAGEAEDRVRQGLATLPRLQREVFLLRAQEGSDYGDIAAALGTTPGAARVHYHHAVKRLKELVR